ncbi:MAG: hypothetical protein Q8R47_03135 [Nanoarchaeota archaeon]|nr:hypothetical protein [Nanoarchaeota archaeon]
MPPKKEPKQLNFHNPNIDFKGLELKLVQPCNLGSAQQATPQHMERARETAKRNGFDYYMFVEQIRDDYHSRPEVKGNIHYYNKKEKYFQIYPPLNRN